MNSIILVISQTIGTKIVIAQIIGTKIVIEWIVWYYIILVMNSKLYYIKLLWIVIILYYIDEKFMINVCNKVFLSPRCRGNERL